MKKTLLPQEIETFYIIPTLRRHIALELKKKGMKQKDVAELLGINTATISQYTSTKRGHQLQFNDEVVRKIKESLPKINDHFSYIREMQLLLRHIRLSRTFCRIHKQFSNIPLQCSQGGCLC